MLTGTEPAHKLLEYLITRATVSEKPLSSTLRLSLQELQTAIGQPTEVDADLLIELKLSFVPPQTFEELDEEEYE